MGIALLVQVLDPFWEFYIHAKRTQCIIRNSMLIYCVNLMLRQIISMCHRSLREKKMKKKKKKKKTLGLNEA